MVSANGTLNHLKDKGHAWIIVLSVVTAAGFLWRAVLAGQSDQQLIASIVLALVAASTVFGGAIALVVIALLKKDQCGELAEFRNWLALGLLVGVAVAAIKLLSLFGVM